MRVLITWGSKRGGTEGIARMLGDALSQEGLDVDVVPSREAMRTTGFDAAIVGGALYANRWHRAARRFVTRREKVLRSVPVWFFSSGPLDDTAARSVIPPTRQVENLMERVGAQGHVTFGGRLLPGARGFPASAMAKTHAGDWRAPDAIRAWAAALARALPTARSGTVTSQPGRSVPRLLVHGLVGWALCGLTMVGLLLKTTLTAALVIHALAVPLVFTAVAMHYFRARGAREPFIVALSFAGIVALLDLVIVAGVVQRSWALFGSTLGLWLPLALIVLTAWAIGELLLTMPRTGAPQTRAAA